MLIGRETVGGGGELGDPEAACDRLMELRLPGGGGCDNPRGRSSRKCNLGK